MISPMGYANPEGASTVPVHGTGKLSEFTNALKLVD